MQSLNFESNKKRYCINNDESKVIEFDPSDITIIERIRESEKVFEELKNIKSKSENFEDVADTLKEIDIRVRKQINYIFDGDIANTVFGNKNPMSTLNGVTLVERFINSVKPELKKAVEIEQRKTLEKINKYTTVAKRFK